MSLAAAEHHGQVKFGGLPVPGATVTATQGDKKFVAVSDLQGAYSFPDLADGVWTMQIEMLCFSPIKQEVAIGLSPEWNLKLLPLDEIKAAAGPATPAPAPTQQIVAPAVSAIPPAKRRASAGFQRTDLNATAPAPPSEAEPAATTGDLSRSASDVFSINGSVNNGAFSPFAQSQAFGNNRRGGRSLYNAGLGVFLNNSALDARSFSLTGQNTPKPAYNRLQGGLTLGGPLRIPRLAPGNSLNFFLAYQWARNRNAGTQSGLMPSLPERTGDLSKAPTILDPTSGLPFPGAVIPQSRISPQATALLNYYPLPNFDPGARYNYQVPLVGISDQDSVQSRLSKSFNVKNQVFGAFAYQRTATENPNLFAFRDTTNMSGINASAGWSHRFATRLFAVLKYDFSRLSTRVTPYFANRKNVSGEAGISGNNQDPLNWGPPSLGFSSGIAGLSDARQSFTRNQTSAVSTDIFWSRNGHNFKFGGDYRRQQFNHLSQQDARGAFTFTGASTGSDFAGFLLGIPDTSSIAFGAADKYFRASSYAAYITDDWRISPALTVNAGVRWEYGSPITELYGRLVNLDIAPGFVAEAPVVSRNPAGALTGQKYPDSLVQPDKHGVEPRIGIAWRPFLASSTVIRCDVELGSQPAV